MRCQNSACQLHSKNTPFEVLLMQSCNAQHCGTLWNAFECRRTLLIPKVFLADCWLLGRDSHLRVTSHRLRFFATILRRAADDK